MEKVQFLGDELNFWPNVRGIITCVRELGDFRDIYR